MTDSTSIMDLSKDSNDNNKGKTFDLGLDMDEDHHALRFLSLPVSKHLLAYGGDTGEVFCIQDDISSNSSSPSTTRLVRRWEEEAVRCMAASPSGQYIAVGFEDGSTQIYIYPKNDITTTFHPFVGKIDENKKDESQEEDTLLSQTSDSLLSPRRGENMVYGPSYNTPNKDLLFLNEEYLGIANEQGFCIVSIQDVIATHTHKATTTTRHYLEEEQKEAHKDSGCRGLTWMPHNRTLVSLAMDGHVCFWDLSHIKDPTKWKLLKREVTKAICKIDAGEMLDDGDVWGRSCRPALDFDQHLLALPGEPYWQIRTIETSSSSSGPAKVNEQTLLETTLNGHVESMVVLKSSPHANDPYWVSTGRDGRVIVWKVNKDNSGTYEFEAIHHLTESQDPAPIDMYWNGGEDNNNNNDEALYVLMPDAKVTVWKGREALGLPPLARGPGEKERAGTSSVSTKTTTAAAVSKAKTSPSSSFSSSSSSRAPSKSLPLVENAATVPLVEKPSSVKGASVDKPSPIKAAEVAKGTSPEAKSSSTLPTSPPAASVPESSKVASPAKKVSAASSPSSAPPVEKAAAEAETANVSSPRKRLQKMNDKNNDDDDDDDVVFSQQTPEAPAAALPPPTTNRSDFIDDEAHDDDDDDGFPDGDGGDDGLDDNNNPATAIDSPNGNGSNDIDDNMEDEEDDDDDDDFGRASYNPMTSSMTNTQAATISWPKPQPPFAPSSTPLDLPRRYMCWNHVGSVVLRQGEAGVSRTSVDIDFNDSAFRRPLSFTDNMGFIVGSLGEDGGIFASDVADDDDDKDLADVVDGVQVSEMTMEALRKSRAASKGAARGSTIYFHRYETFAALRDKDWYLTLPDGERVVGCASGQGWAAVITSRRFLRLFTSGGNQGQVIWLDGEPVTIVGRSRFLAVFFHQSMPLPDGTQKLGYLFYDTVTNRVIGKGTVGCLSTGSHLQWAGFSKELSLLAMDRDGMMSMLISSEPATNWEWMPVLDTVGLRKSAEDSFWPVQVSDGKLVCVPLKGGLKYPDATRRPITSSLALRLPFARGPLTQTNALEELSVRACVALSQKRIVQEICLEGGEDEKFEEEFNNLSAQVDKVTLKMFASIVTANKLERALELMDRLHLEKSFELAMTIADRHRKLVDLIEQARDRKFGGGDEFDDEYDDDGGLDANNNTEFESPPTTYEHEEEDFHPRRQQQPRITPDSGFSRKQNTKRPYEASSVPPPQGREVRRKQSFLRGN